MRLKQTRRYDVVAMTLHWLIAAAIIGMIPFGWWMDELPNSLEKIQIYQWHKSVGLTVLALSLIRLAWRLSHRPPPLPAHMARWELLAARGAHWAFYALMIAMPLMGWALVSASPLNLPTQFFFLFEWPHLPFFAEMSRESKETVSGVFAEIHSKMAWGFIVLIVLHVAAALKHQFADRMDMFQRMTPFPFSKKDD